jgi:hypothetical protein
MQAKDVWAHKEAVAGEEEEVKEEEEEAEDEEEEEEEEVHPGEDTVRLLRKSPLTQPVAMGWGGTREWGARALPRGHARRRGGGCPGASPVGVTRGPRPWRRGRGGWRWAGSGGTRGGCEGEINERREKSNIVVAGQPTVMCADPMGGHW